jgi:hypothetical protein
MDPARVESIATAAAAGIAIVGVAVTVYFARRAERASHDAYSRAGLTTLQDWRRDLRGWADEAIDVMSALEYHLQFGGAVADVESRTAVHRLSALIDRGRYFFPNQDRETHGLDALPAFRGYRHAALDPLVAALRVAEGFAFGRFDSPAEAVREMRRIFVSLTQSVLDPDHQNTRIAELIRESHLEGASDEATKALRPSGVEIPPGAAALLEKGATSRLRAPGS